MWFYSNFFLCKIIIWSVFMFSLKMAVFHDKPVILASIMIKYLSTHWCHYQWNSNWSRFWASTVSFNGTSEREEGEKKDINNFVHELAESCRDFNVRISTWVQDVRGKTVVDIKVHNWYMRVPVAEGESLGLKGF